MPLKNSPATPAAEPRKIEAAKPAARPEVKGQVAMHAIITGYEVASHLAPVIAAGVDKTKETLHALAAEVAAKIEAYTFRE
jgi:hypothetical protein